MESSCAHCGTELAPGEQIRAGPWRLSPWLIEFDGRRVPVTPAEANVLYTLARAGGVIVAPEAIGERFGSRDPSRDTVRALVMRLRKKLGSRCPVETIRNHGYRWDGPATTHGRIGHAGGAADRARAAA